MKPRGFTLIEMVMTLIVGSILVLGIAGFVDLGARGYSDTIERQRMQTQAKFVLEKMSREIRHAVPNMFSNDLVTGASDCISFYPIVTSGFYAVSGADLQFVVGSNGVTTNDIDSFSLVINPTEASPSNNVFPLSSVSSANNVFVLAGQAANLNGNSVSNRHYIYNPDGEVSYCLVNQQVHRLVNRVNLAPVSDSGVTGSLNYTPATVQNNGVVHINLNFTNDDGDESTNFRQDVQVLNVP
ncbi:PulJ/GspJ family protein [Vibrio atypicus]|uniref:PulJ/GspJ family protein n=1 Tax=Vibrio atypicus TaxID=558271 RepID=UPI00135B3A26|nr:prepilin-type N-terminal cleavage/methylation domain-containing protein [Vibrio atypicus]